MNTFLDEPTVKAINLATRLMTHDLRLCGDRVLLLSVGEGIPSEPEASVAGIDGVTPIARPSAEAVVKFQFTDFITFAVTEEMFVAREPGASGGTRWIRVYESSNFLDFVQRTTWASSNFPGPLYHFQVNTLDHRVDIVSPKAPAIIGSLKQPPKP